MGTWRHDVPRIGGLAATHELLAAGHTQMSLRSATSRGDIIRVRKGWYCLPEVTVSRQRAARVGGRLTCVSAASEAGLWVPETDSALHVRVRQNACQLRDRDDFRQRLSESIGANVLVHWTDTSRGGSRFQVSMVDALSDLITCQRVEFAFVVCESALHLRGISLARWSSLKGSLPVAQARSLAHVGRESESGTESMFSWRMRAIGVAFMQQVRIGQDRVDFLIGGRLVVEVDSLTFHDPTADRARDARLGIRGYRVLRFLYGQIVYDWPVVEAAVLAAISRGDHLPA